MNTLEIKLLPISDGLENECFVIDGTPLHEYLKKMMNDLTYIYRYRSPLGDITIASDGKAITGLWFDGQKFFGDTLGKNVTERSLPVFTEAVKWLDIYFSGEIPDFTPPICLKTTSFRKAVCDIMLTIPYGQTKTYGEIANIIAKQKGIERMSAQAIGGAVGHNPISIIIPCHRVVGANGSLTGYAGGLDKKTELLKLEKSYDRTITVKR